MAEIKIKVSADAESARAELSELQNTADKVGSDKALHSASEDAQRLANQLKGASGEAENMVRQLGIGETKVVSLGASIAKSITSPIGLIATAITGAVAGIKHLIDEAGKGIERTASAISSVAQNANARAQRESASRSDQLSALDLLGGYVGKELSAPMGAHIDRLRAISGYTGDLTAEGLSAYSMSLAGTQGGAIAATMQDIAGKAVQAIQSALTQKGGYQAYWADRVDLASWQNALEGRLQDSTITEGQRKAVSDALSIANSAVASVNALQKESDALLKRMADGPSATSAAGRILGGSGVGGMAVDSLQRIGARTYTDYQRSQVEDQQLQVQTDIRDNLNILKTKMTQSMHNTVDGYFRFP